MTVEGFKGFMRLRNKSGLFGVMVDFGNLPSGYCLNALAPAG